MSWEQFVEGTNGFSVFAASNLEVVEEAIRRAGSDLHWPLARQTPNVGSDGCLLLRGSLGTLTAFWMVRRNHGWFRKARINQTILGACNWVSSGQPRGRPLVSS